VRGFDLFSFYDGLVLKLAVVLFGLTYVHPMFLIGVGTNYM
jgi:hypothetical protein